MREQTLNFGKPGDAQAAVQAPEPVALSGGPLVAQVVEAIRTVFDPEIPVNVYDLGLIYAVALDANNNVQIKMTLTAPGCPVAGSLPVSVREAVARIGDIGTVGVELVWDPPWTQARMSDEARLELGLL